MNLARLRLPLLALGGTLVLTLTAPTAPVARADEFSPPFGILGGTFSTTPTSNIGVDEVAVEPLTTFFTVTDPQRVVKVTVSLRVQATIAPLTGNVYVDYYRETGCPPSCPAIRVAGSNTYLTAAGGAGSETMVVTGFATLTQGTWSVRVFGKRALGNGTMAVSSTAGTPQSVLVEDVGLF